MYPGRAAVTTPALYPASSFVPKGLRKTARKRLEIPLWGCGMLPSPERSHTTAHRGKQGGYSCAEVLRDDTTSRRKRMCAFTACVRFLRLRSPAGLRSLFFDYSVVIFAPPAVWPKHGSNRATTGEHRVLRKSAHKRLEVLLCGRDTDGYSFCPLRWATFRCDNCYDLETDATAQKHSAACSGDPLQPTGKRKPSPQLYQKKYFSPLDSHVTS